jgi:hypothetical protein
MTARKRRHPPSAREQCQPAEWAESNRRLSLRRGRGPDVETTLAVAGAIEAADTQASWGGALTLRSTVCTRLEPTTTGGPSA